MRGRAKDFHIDGSAQDVIKGIADSFIKEKRGKRSEAIDNLQSRLMANAVVLMDADYIDFETLLEKIGTLEKSVVDKKRDDTAGIDRLEAFMQGLEKSDIKASEPIAAPDVADDDDEDLEPLGEERETSEMEPVEDRIDFA